MNTALVCLYAACFGLVVGWAVYNVQNGLDVLNQVASAIVLVVAFVVSAP